MLQLGGHLPHPDPPQQVGRGLKDDPVGRGRWCRYGMVSFGFGFCGVFAELFLKFFAFFLFVAGIEAHSALYAQPVVDPDLLCLLIEYERGALKLYDALFAADAVFFNGAYINNLFGLQFCVKDAFTPGDDNGRTRRQDLFNVRRTVGAVRGRAWGWRLEGGGWRLIGDS